MKPFAPKYLIQDRICAESDCKRGIPHLIELRNQLDTVNSKLGTMTVSTARTLRHKRLTTRSGTQKSSVGGGMEADADENINSEQSSETSSDDSDAEDTNITMHHFQPRTPGNAPLEINNTNSIILSMLKTNGKIRPARASTTVGFLEDSMRLFDGKRDGAPPTVNKIGRRAYNSDGLGEASQADVHIPDHVFVDVPRKEWRKISVMNKFIAEDCEVASQYTDIESPDEGTLVNSVCDAEHGETDTSIDPSHLTVDFSSLQLSPLSDTTFRSAEQSSDNGIFDEGDTVLHNVPAVKFENNSLYTQKQTQSKHCRDMSTNSFMNNGNKASIPLRARSRTNDGMLQLKTSTSASNTPKKLAHQHHRKLSINLPIKVQSTPQLMFPVQAPPTPSPPTISVPMPSVSTLDERELEYKHRHTFIGTASLDDFLEVLEITTNHTTTKPKVAKAFIILAATEQVLARQSSTHGTGWQLVSRITPDVASGHTDYLAQAHVKLGSVTLRQFLELIPFDGKDVTEAMGVVEAFCAASHMDRIAGSGATSKAKAFRGWMLRK